MRLQKGFGSLVKRSVVVLAAITMISTLSTPAVADAKKSKLPAKSAQVEVTAPAEQGGEDYVSYDITIEGNAFVSDSFNGVDAVYRTGASSTTDGTNPTYSCAAYIKKYYKALYGLDVYNLNNGCTPLTNGDSFLRVSTPIEGDIVATTNHWSIVKKVNNDGTITLIEQNYKWSQGSGYACRVNRHIPVNSATYYRLSSVERQRHVVVNAMNPL